MDSQSKSPKFFKVILKDTITQRRLEIPTGFVREFGNCLSNPTIILKVPNGKKWQVEMSKVGEDQIWLEKGWVEFSEYHSLKYGHLLVFNYEGNSYFNVHIFDMSAMEIEYPPGTSTAPISRDLQIEQFGGNVASSSKVDTSATNFTSSNPWFKVVFGKNRYLNIPFSFVEEHMDSELKTVMLKVEDKSWPVKWNIIVNRQKKVSRLNGGLPCFARDNSLKEGDVCVFELINNNNIFSVSIFRM